MTAATRVVVVGARRVRHGIGEFVARTLAEAGAEICGVVGTRPSSAEEAASNLKNRYGIRARPFTALSDAIDAENPDGVAICGPHETHRPHLLETAAAGCHALCEKPMWVQTPDDPVDDLLAETRRLVDGFSSRGRTLALITPWPHTLDAFYELHPKLRGARVEQFSMELGPPTLGTAGIWDAMPHVISMLQALVGPGEVQDLRGESPAPERGRGEAPGAVQFDFIYRAAGGAAVESRVRLEACPTHPRPARYGVNGHQADRQIRLPEYRFELEAEGRTVELEDPLLGLAKSFLEATVSAEPPDAAALLGSMAGLEPFLKWMREASTENKACP